MAEVLIFRICQNADVARAAELSRSIRDHSAYPSFRCIASIVQSYLEQRIHATNDAKRTRGRFGGPATCNLRKVQVSGKRLMRATCEYGPLFRAIKQFPRTHGIMFLLFSIGSDIEREERKMRKRATKMG